MKRLFPFLALLVALAAPVFWLLTKAQTTNYYVLAAAAPGGDGSAWGTAFQCIPTDANLVRGAIYWIGPGDYRELCDGGAKREFIKAVNANHDRIVFRRAIDANHGPAGDWPTNCSGCGSGQAIFHPWRFQTDDWTVDGQTRTDYRAGYLLRITSVKPDGINSYNPNSSGNRWVLGGGCYSCGQNGGTSASNLTFQYTLIDGTKDLGANIDLSEDGIYVSSNNFTYSNNILISHNAIIRLGNSNVVVTVTNLTEEYNWEAYNYGDTAHHSEGNAIEGSFTNVIIRYNIFEDLTSTAAISTPGSQLSTASGLYVYGNVYMQSVDNPENVNTLGGNGFLAILSCTVVTGLYIYNNSVVNLDISTGHSLQPRLYTITPQTNTASPCYPSGGSVINFAAENNLWYNGSTVDSSSAQNSRISGAFVWDYNSYYDTPHPNDLSPQVKSYTGINPFVGYSSKDFRLALATDSGITLAAPYNLDPLGTTRGADGNWDRGTFDFAGSGAAGSCSELLTLTASAAASRAGAGVNRKACKP